MHTFYVDHNYQFSANVLLNTDHFFFHSQWNPVNAITNRPQKSGHINRVTVLKGFFKYR